MNIIKVEFELFTIVQFLSSEYMKAITIYFLFDDFVGDFLSLNLEILNCTL